MDWFDDFGDIENEDIIDEDSFELEENLEMDDPFADDSEIDDESVQSEDDEFTAKDAFYTGTFAGWAYEEGLRRRKRKKFRDD